MHHPSGDDSKEKMPKAKWSLRENVLFTSPLASPGPPIRSSALRNHSQTYAASLTTVFTADTNRERDSGESDESGESQVARGRSARKFITRYTRSNNKQDSFFIN